VSAVDEVEELIEKYRLATAEFLQGDPEPYKGLFSHREDVTLANPLFPVVRGWDDVCVTLERTASRLRDGEFLGSEIVAKCVTPELAYVVQLARERAKVGGNEVLTPIDLRNTMILRPEGGTWKIVHLHGDPITTPRPAESVIQE
jgi:ketosteroid isomerase-like protein